jgi:hypothetical protein
MKEHVLRPDLDCEVPKGISALLHGKELDTSDLFPALREETRSEFSHEFGKGEFENHLTINQDPIFVLLHCGRGEVTLEKNRDLVWHVLLNNCVFRV